MDTLSGISPRYPSATSSQLTISSHYRQNAKSDYMHSSLKTPVMWGETFQSLWGCMDICPLLNQFHVTSITYSELSSLTSLKAWGDVEKFCSDLALTYWCQLKAGTVGDRIYGLSMIWVNPYQARVPNVEEVVKQLTMPMVPTGADWPYALVQLNGDTCHVPLPREGHLSTLVEDTSSATCRRIGQLEAHQLLSSNCQVIYPARLNGCEVPVIASLPKSLAKGTNLLGTNPFTYKWTSCNPTQKSQNSKCCPLAVTPPPS